MARLRNAAGVVMSVADEKATRLRDYGWGPAEADEKAESGTDKPKAAPRRRSASKKSD